MAFASRSFKPLLKQWLQSALADVVGFVSPSGTANILPAGTVDTGITASASSDQAGATQLNYRISEITVVATAGDSVKLPQADVVGMTMLVVNNDAAESADVFPFLGDSINQLAVNLALAVANNVATYFICVAPGRWRSK